MGFLRRRGSRGQDDWVAVRHLFAETEHEIDAVIGWILGVSIGDPSVDHPCGVYLTDRAIYVDIRPQTMQPAPEVVVALFTGIEKIGVQPNDVGGTRLIFVVNPLGRGEGDIEDARGIAVDLPEGKRGQAFGQLAVDTAQAGGA